VLDDTKPEERAKGILAGFRWGMRAEMRAFYVDLGWSGGMNAGLDEARRRGQPTEFRTLPGWSRRSAVVEDLERAMAGGGS
jgi:hypothetical protein